MESEAKEFLDSIDFMPFIRSHNYGIGISRYEFFAFLWSNTIGYWHEMMTMEIQNVLISHLMA